MAKLRVTTFNIENLFNRYALLDEPWENRNYEKLVQAVGLASIASRDGNLVSYETTAVQRDNTARVIIDSKPDVLAVQEVENLYTLRIFNQKFLKNYFDRIILIDGNDPRGIDVGLMIRKGVKLDVTAIHTFVDEGIDGKQVFRGAGSVQGIGYPAQNAVFSRDCLMVEAKFAGKDIAFLVNHLKAQDGQASSDKRRKGQAERVVQISKDCQKRGVMPIVLGDLNADVAGADQNKNKAKKAAGESLVPLVRAKNLVDTFKDVQDNWSHFYESGDDVSRLDYILADKNLAVSDRLIVRNGLSLKCEQYTGPRYPTVSLTHSEASDHCAVTTEFSV